MTDAFPYTRAAIKRLCWNLVSFLFIGTSYCAVLVWRVAGFFNEWTLGLAERAGQRADYWDAVMRELRAHG